MNVAISQLGILVNLQYPKLVFKSPVQVVKQGFSTFVVMFGSMIIVVALLFIYLATSSIMTFTLYCLLVIALFIMAIIVQNYILNNWAVKKFRNL
ncbi:hypothetical protein D3C76_1684640 [compost metagenome]